MPDPFADLLLRLRQDAGRTQEEQADAINAVSGRDTMTRREISRYENFENIPTNHTIGHIAAACGVPFEELQREAKAARARKREGHTNAGEDQDAVKRRTLLGGAAIGVSAAAEPWGRLAFALSKGSKIDSTSAVALIDRAAELHVQELNLSARRLQSTVESHLDAITVALPRAGEHEQALTIAAGETAALAGWVAWDLGERDKADAYYKVMSQCAATAGHPPLRALALTYTSYAASTPKAKLEFLSQAASDVRGHGNATAAAWVLGRHAEEAAAAGDETGALRALERARFVYDFADHTSEHAWVRFVTPYRMDSLVLSVYGKLGRPELTATADTAVDRLGDELPDGGVVVLGDLASALLRGGDVDQGVYASRQFASAAQAKPNTMGKERASTIAASLPHRERELAIHLAKAVRIMSPSRGTRASPGRERRRTAGPSLLSPVPSPRPPRTDTPPTLRSRASAAPAPAGAVRAAFLNVKDAAEHLGLSPHTLYVWRHRRQGPSSFRMGPRGRVMYRREAVDAWIREQEQADSRSNAVLSPLSATPQLRPSRIPNA